MHLIKIIDSSNNSKLEELANDFLSVTSSKIIDIKYHYQSTEFGTKCIVMIHHEVNYKKNTDNNKKGGRYHDDMTQGYSQDDLF